MDTRVTSCSQQFPVCSRRRIGPHGRGARLRSYGLPLDLVDFLKPQPRSLPRRYALDSLVFLAAVGARMVSLPVADLPGRQQAVSGSGRDRIRRLRLGFMKGSGGGLDVLHLRPAVLSIGSGQQREGSQAGGLRARPEVADSDCDKHGDRTIAAVRCAVRDAIGGCGRGDASSPAPNQSAGGGAPRMRTASLQCSAVRTGTRPAPERPRSPSRRLEPCSGSSRARHRRSAGRGHPTNCRGRPLRSPRSISRHRLPDLARRTGRTAEIGKHFLQTVSGTCRRYRQFRARHVDVAIGSSAADWNHESRGLSAHEHRPAGHLRRTWHDETPTPLVQRVQSSIAEDQPPDR